MRSQKRWLVSSIFALGLILAACRTPLPTSMPTALSIVPTTTASISVSSTAGPIQAPSMQPLPSYTPTKIPPTPTPLPTWPERWQPSGGPYGGIIEAVAVNPTDSGTLYAAGMGGVVFKSNDAGETWSPGDRLAPPSCPFFSLAIDAQDSSVVYAANSCTGIFKSADAGVTWSHADDGIDRGASLLVQSPHAPGLLLAADDSGHIYRSRDKAISWEPISDGLPGDPIRGIVAPDPDTYWATTDNGHAGQLYRFSGGVWSAVAFDSSPQTAVTNVLVDPVVPTTLFVGLESEQGANLSPDTVYLYRSTDAGYSWSPLQSPALSDSVSVYCPVMKAGVYLLGKGRHSGVLYTACGGKLLSSSDGGINWTSHELPQDVLATNDLRQMAIHPTDDDVLYLPLRGPGIGKSEDGGRTWRTINRGLDNVTVSLIATHPTDPATLYVAPNEGATIFKSVDYGDSWTQLKGGSLDHPTARRADELVLDAYQSDTIFQVLDVARVFRSDDGGANWSVAWPEFRLSSIYSLAIATADPAILYVNKSGFGLFRSDDGGNSWRLLPESGVDYTYALAIHPQNINFVLSGDNRTPTETSAQLHRSRDGGITWDVPLEVPDAFGITSAAFDPRVEPYFSLGRQPADPTRLYAASTGPRGVLWFSNDAGDSWKTLNDAFNFTVVNLLIIAPHRPGVAFAGVRGGGTWRTEDGGQSWHRLLGDPATSAAAIALDPNNHNIIYIADGTIPHLYRSTDNGNNWELLFQAGADYDRLGALALAPSDPRVLYLSALQTTDGSASGAVFRIETNAPPGENAINITGNLPGAVSSMAIDRYDPFRVLATVYGKGLWKTTDGGASWRQLKNGLPELSFFQIAIDPSLPDTLFLAGGDYVRPDTLERSGLNPDEMYGIWKSTDDGNSWTKVGGATLGRASGPIRAIAFHPEDQRVMYAAGEGGVYLSPDRGETWTSVNGRLPFVPMNTIATDGQTLFVGSAGGGVFSGAIHPLIHTADWVPESHLVIPIHHIQITLHPADPQTLYASSYPGGVFKTTDGGANWTAHYLGLPSFAVADPWRQGHYALASAPSTPEVLYLGLYAQGIYRSDDGASTWRPAHGQEGQLRKAKIQTLLVHPDDADIVYAATEDGIWRTINGGDSWAEFSAGLPGGGDVRTLVISNQGQLYAGTRGYGLYTRSAFRQAENDAWRQLPELGNWGIPWPLHEGRPLYQYTSLLVRPGDSNALFAGTFPGGIYKTSDDGLHWREHNTGLGNDGVLTLVSHPTDAQILYAGTTDGIARSVDGGANWHPWDIGWPPQQRVLSIAVDPNTPDVLYACSTDEANAHGTVMKSTDGGANWFEITTGLNLNQAFYRLLIDHFDPSVIYLATQREGIHISRDSGTSWTSWNEGLWNRVTGGGPNVTDVLQFSADGRLLYYGTAGSGVWRRPAEGAP